MTVELLIILTLVLGLVSYFMGRFNKVYGAVVTIIASMFVFISVGYMANDILDGSTFNYNAVKYLPVFATFTVSYLGIFFAILVTFVFAMVSFFNPFFVEKYKYPAVYNMLYIFSLAGVLGVFFTDNLMVLFFFFEFVVWSGLFIIPLGKSKKAAVSYYAFSTAGSFALLYAIFIMRDVAGTYNLYAGLASVSGTTQGTYVMILLSISAFSKLGAFPLHTWLPAAHGNAPHPFKIGRASCRERV